MNPQSSYLERTEKLYETNENGYIYEFDAKVISCEEKDNYFLVELDKTAFFPEGGGQYADRGFINDEQVFDVQIYEGKIFHFLKTAFKVGQDVHGRLDKELRFSRMQNHSGEHILSGLIHNMYGYENVGFHMSDDEMTIDTSGPLTDEMIKKVQDAANEIIYENRKIKTYYPSEKELEKLEYRSKTEITGKVRITEIEGVDSCACCAPHLCRTGEVGIIYIKGKMKHKSGTRLTVSCGKNAYEYLSLISEENEKISRLLSSLKEKTYEAVLRQIEITDKKSEEIRLLHEKILSLRLDSMQPTDKNICVFEDGCDNLMLRLLMNGGIEKTSGIFAAFSEKEGGGYIYVIGQKDKDLSYLAKEMREKLNAKGGGKGSMLSGFVDCDREKAEQFFMNIK